MFSSQNLKPYLNPEKKNHATLQFYYLSNHPITAQWIELKFSGIMLLIPTNILT